MNDLESKKNNSIKYYQEHQEEIKQKKREYYQQHKEERKKQRRERYLREKEQEMKKQGKILGSYYDASSIQVLLNLKEYTELNASKKKLWADFCWTLKDCQVGVNDIMAVMKLQESAENLINDYWLTAKHQEKTSGKSWNSLSAKEQARLIARWGQEKAAQELLISKGLVELVEKGKEQEKELEMKKFHEERGKIKCECWQCEVKQEFRKEIKREQKARRKKEEQAERLRCEGCNKLVEELEEVSGVCKKCEEKFE